MLLRNVYQLQDIFQLSLRDIFDQGIGGNRCGQGGDGPCADQYQFNLRSLGVCKALQTKTYKTCPGCGDSQW